MFSQRGEKKASIVLIINQRFLIALTDWPTVTDFHLGRVGVVL